MKSVGGPHAARGRGLDSTELEAEFMKQQLFCNRTRSFNSFFYKLLINIIFPLSVVYGIMVVLCMYEFMYISVYMYVDVHAYMCVRLANDCQCQTENKLVDLL